MIAVSIFWWPWYSRLVRTEIRAARATPHVEAAVLAGASHMRLLTHYLLPAAVPVIIVTATLDVANVVLILSVFSFLGLGAPAPAPELGAMSSRSLENLVDFWWVPVLPALAIFLLVLCANIAGDLMRRRLAFQ
jgi:peptide/nickel transport system permease protein